MAAWLVYEGSNLVRCSFATEVFVREALDAEAVQGGLSLDKLSQAWTIQACSAIKGENVAEGVGALIATVSGSQ